MNRMLWILFVVFSPMIAAASDNRPNILFIISDDQSYAHTSLVGCGFVDTPNFDRLADEGIYFNNAYVSSPGCSPSRASILTGKHTWQIAEAGTHASSFPTEYPVFPDVLEEHGYYVGYTGKGWGPGDWAISGRNPAGTEFNDKLMDRPPFTGISKKDYTGNFLEFLEQKPGNSPFCFWLGTHEPHRVFERDSYMKKDKQLSQAETPGFLPDADSVRGDLLDYAVEIEHFDKVIGEVLSILEERGELDNTLIIVTSDNGMAFPRAKANCFDYGVHVPLAMRWGDKFKGGQRVQTPVSLMDTAPTILEAAGVEPQAMEVQGRSLFSSMTDDDPDRAVFSARERHSYSRYNNWTYPQRSMRKGKYLIVRNFKPDRWPAGDPVYVDEQGELRIGYTDIDGSPTKTYLIIHQHEDSIDQYFRWAVDKRPEYELYDVETDSSCLDNLAGVPLYDEVFSTMKSGLNQYLKETGDPRIVGDDPEIFESYPRLKGVMRDFPELNTGEHR